MSDERMFNVVMMAVSAVCLVGCTLSLLCGCETKSNGIGAERHNEGIDGRFAYDIPYKDSVNDYTFNFGEIVDTETGVRYLVMYNGSKWSISGIAPLLDSDGRVMVDERYANDGIEVD